MSRAFPHVDKAIAPNVIPMVWPVYGFKDGRREYVAQCDTYDAAVTLVNGSTRNLHIGQPKYAWGQS